MGNEKEGRTSKLRTKIIDIQIVWYFGITGVVKSAGTYYLLYIDLDPGSLAYKWVAVGKPTYPHQYQSTGKDIQQGPGTVI